MTSNQYPNVTADRLLELVEQWHRAGAELAFLGDEYDGAEEEAQDAMSKVYIECADTLQRLITFDHSPLRSNQS